MGDLKQARDLQKKVVSTFNAAQMMVGAQGLDVMAGDVAVINVGFSIDVAGRIL